MSSSTRERRRVDRAVAAEGQRAKPRGSQPRSVDTARSARAIVAFATRCTPQAASSTAKAERPRRPPFSSARAGQLAIEAAGAARERLRG